MGAGAAIGTVSDLPGIGQRVVSDLSQDVDGLSRTWTDAGERCMATAVRSDESLARHRTRGKPRPGREGAKREGDDEPPLACAKRVAIQGD